MRKTKAFLSLTMILFAFATTVKAEYVDLGVWTYDVNAEIMDWTGGNVVTSTSNGNANNNKRTVTTTEKGAIRVNESEVRWGTKTSKQSQERASKNSDWQNVGAPSETWGSYSGLEVEGHNGTYNSALQETFRGVTFTHTNKSLTNINSPDSFDLAFEINLYSDSFENSLGKISETVNLSLHTGFWETPNSGAPGFSEDIFFFLDPFENFYQEIGDTGMYLSLAASFTALSGDMYDEAYDRLVNDLGYNFNHGDQILGLITTEKTINEIGLNFTITGTPPDESIIITDPTSTPEPASMLIFGMGLTGLGIMGRRRMRKNDK